jgi:hypothetical protein
MLTKDSLLKFDPDARAFTLVGAFLGYFALLEQGIESALGEIVGIRGAQRVIIGRNMGFDDKIKTLRSLVAFFIVNKNEAKRFDDLAKRARKYGELRNIIVHSPFRRSTKSDGVEFFAISATRKLEFPDMDWSIEDFLNRIDDINAIDNELRAVDRQMSIQRIAEALMQAPKNEKGLGALFGLGAALAATEPDGPPALPETVDDLSE